MQRSQRAERLSWRAHCELHAFCVFGELKLYLFRLGEKPLDVVAGWLFAVVRNEITVDEDTLFASTGITGWVIGVFSDRRGTKSK